MRIVFGFAMPKSRCAFLLPLVLLVGCSSGGSQDGFSVEPAEPTVHVGEQLVLLAQPQEDMAREPEWDVQETFGGGFTQSKGLRATYVAPAMAGKYHVVIRSVRANGTQVRTVQEIHVLPVMAIQPATARVAPGATLPLSLKLKGLQPSAVQWSLEESGAGTLQQDGLYTAPDHAGTYHVVVTSTQDPEASVRAEIRVE